MALRPVDRVQRTVSHLLEDIERLDGRVGLLEVLFELHDHDVLHVAHTLASLLGNLNRLLVLALPVVGEPACDLFGGETSFVGQHIFVSLAYVRMLYIVEKPPL